MKFTIEDLKNFEDNFLQVLIQKEINEAISKGHYPPREEWSPGSEKMIYSFKSAAIRHSFKKARDLLQQLEEVCDECSFLKL